MTATEYIDLSQPIRTGMTIFPGDPVPVIIPADGTIPPWRVTALRLGTHTGTHIDSASHYLPGGKTIVDYEIKRFILSGMVLPLEGFMDDQPIMEEYISPWMKDFPGGGALLFRTRWDQYWNSARYMRHPYLADETVSRIIQAGVSLVGIDALNVDSTVESTDHVHRSLLEKDILIVENLANLDRLQPRKVYQFSFLPLNLPGLDGSPIRAVAWENNIKNQSKGEL
jgi:arylformamidase